LIMPKACYSHDKRSKKLFPYGARALHREARSHGIKVFCFFFSKKKRLLAYFVRQHYNLR